MENFPKRGFKSLGKHAIVIIYLTPIQRSSKNNQPFRFISTLAIIICCSENKFTV